MSQDEEWLGLKNEQLWNHGDSQQIQGGWGGRNYYEMDGQMNGNLEDESNEQGCSV